LSTTVSGGAAAQVPRSFAALRDRDYRGYFFSMAGAMMADSIEHVISYWVMFQKFHSPVLNGFAVVSHWLPFLLFGAVAGALAERFDPRRIIQIGMAIFMFVSICWGVLFITDGLQMWHAVVLLILHGVAGVLWSPTSQVLVHDIVAPELLPSAVRSNATSRYLGLLLGPGIGGVILLVLGPKYGILVNALLYIPTIVWLQYSPSRIRSGLAERLPPRAIKGLSDIVATVREITANPVLISMILLGGAASFFVGNAYQAQMPSFALDLGQFEADFAYTMLLGADAAGALTAGIILESHALLPPHPRTAILLAMVWCGALIGFAAVKLYPLALALLFIAGFVELAFNAMSQTLVQLNAPADIRGRVIGVFSMSNLGLRMFSGLTVGFVGGLIGPRLSLGVSAAILLIVIASLFVVLNSRQLTDNS